MDTFWGDRYALVRDPFGHRWSLATLHEDLSAAEFEERADRWADDHPDVPNELNGPKLYRSLPTTMTPRWDKGRRPAAWSPGVPQRADR